MRFADGACGGVSNPVAQRQDSVFAVPLWFVYPAAVDSGKAPCLRGSVARIIPSP